MKSSEQDLLRLFDSARAAGWSTDEVLAFSQKRFGLWPRELSRRQLLDLIVHLNTLATERVRGKQRTG